MDILLQIVIVVCITLLIIFFICQANRKEGYMMFLGFATPYKARSLTIKPRVNTPLVKLRSKLKRFDEVDLPAFFSYNPKKIAPIQNQGKVCGSCWAFVTAGFLSDRVAIHTGARIMLSPQQLLQCYVDPEGKRNGCKGASPEDVFEWMEKNGVKLDLQKKIPYLQRNTPIIPSGCPEVTKGVSVRPDSLYSLVSFVEVEDMNKKKYNKKDYDTIKTNIRNMKTELVTDGPIFATMTVYEDFFEWTENYNSGPYTTSEQGMSGGHAIEIIGYCDKGIDTRPAYKDKGYWICKNTWGRDWPSGNPWYPGYFTIEMGRNVCGIESRCGSIQPDVTTSEMVKDISFDDIGPFAREVKL